MSWMNPGSVSSLERQAPPTASAASKTTTAWPARAMVIAAARPFGPAPITTASGARMRRSLRHSRFDDRERRSGRHDAREREAGALEKRVELGLGALPAAGHDQHFEIDHLAEIRLVSRLQHRLEQDDLAVRFPLELASDRPQDHRRPLV